MQKDIRELSNIEGLTQIPNILQLIATRVGSTINFSDIGRLAGIKTTTSPKENDFKGLKKLAELSGSRFKKGIVIYTGEHVLGGYGENLQAVPVGVLWS